MKFYKTITIAVSTVILSVSTGSALAESSTKQQYQTCMAARTEYTEDNLGFFAADSYTSKKSIQELMTAFKTLNPEHMTQGRFNNKVCIDFSNSQGFANIHLIPKGNGVTVDYVTASGGDEKYGFQWLAEDISRIGQ